MAGQYLAARGIDLDAELAKIQFGTDKSGISRHQLPPRYSDVYPSGLLQRILAVRLPHKPVSTLWDVVIADGKIAAIEPHDPRSRGLSHLPGILDAYERLLAPSLCHAHIHLDKCFLLQDPKYSELEIIEGSFEEAMSLTTKAKRMFEHEDLMRRGRQLIEESIQSGVTAMRAFVEVDEDVELKCLEAALELKQEFIDRCEVQICAFAQLPLFSGADGGDANRRLMYQAIRHEGVDVVGSTPYVEQDESKMKLNVRWVCNNALLTGKPLDLHIDYHIDDGKQPFIWHTLEIIKGMNWMERSGQPITLGHCTRLTRFSAEEWSRLKSEVDELPVFFVGLPTSDLFMMRTESKLRGTLHIPEMIEKHNLQGAIAINNVGNAFTPQGSCDPMSIATLGVGLYHAGTKKETEILYECVSTRAKQAIGLPATSLELNVGEPADFVIFDRVGTDWRKRKSITEVIYDAGTSRETVRSGRLTTH